MRLNIGLGLPRFGPFANSIDSRREGTILVHQVTRRVAVLTVGLIVSGCAALPSMAELPDCPERPPVVIDPGHGGIDGGANRDGILEKDLVLDVALRVMAMLQRSQVPVVLTRTADVDLGGRNDYGRLRRDLNQRIRIANECKAALVVSLHVNSAGTPREHGVMVFYQPSRAGRDAAFLIDDVLRRWPLHERQERPHPRGDFAVLRWSRAPAVLVEMGFITNPADRARIVDPAYRERMARAIASACTSIYQIWMKH